MAKLSSGRLAAALLLFAIGGTLVLAEFIYGISNLDSEGGFVAPVVFERLLLHTSLFVLGCVSAVTGCIVYGRTP